MNEHPLALVTGASRRLGLFLCQHLLANHYRVLALTRHSSPELDALQASQALEVYCLQDYNEQAVNRFLADFHQRHTHLAVLIHNASVFEPDPEQFSAEFYQKNFFMHMALPAQLNLGLQSALSNPQQPGNIIHITDIYSELPSPSHALYCSTKAGLQNLASSFAIKFAPGVRVNTIQPGPIQFLPKHSDEHKKAVLAQTLLQTEGGFLPIFQAVKAILDNDYMTGASIKIDGGRALGRGQAKSP